MVIVNLLSVLTVHTLGIQKYVVVIYRVALKYV